jgi:hypothetical protein
MKAKEIFGLILRVVGLFSLLYGGFYLLSCLYILAGSPAREGFGVPQYFLAGVVYVLVGLYFLRGAPHLFRFAYGQDDSPSNPQGGANGEQPDRLEENQTSAAAAPRRSP